MLYCEKCMLLTHGPRCVRCEGSISYSMPSALVQRTACAPSSQLRVSMETSSDTMNEE